MGACDFTAVAWGRTPQEAFRQAVESAQWEHGHGGYSGTIAEKHEFVMISVPKVQGLPTEKQASEYIDKIMYDEMDPRIEDKWGPAGCIEFAPEKPTKGVRHFIFFGYASS
jgi:hypothetical protein